MIRPLHHLSIAEARRLKWEAGRRAYGGDAFVGDPAEELYGELVDALNYCDEARRQGLDLGDVPSAIQPATEALRRILCVRDRHAY